MSRPTNEEIAAAVAVLLRAFPVATISHDDREPLVLVTPAGGLVVQAPSAEAAEACVRRELPPARRSAEVQRRGGVRARLRLVRGGGS